MVCIDVLYKILIEKNAIKHKKPQYLPCMSITGACLVATCIRHELRCMMLDSQYLDVRSKM